MPLRTPFRRRNADPAARACVSAPSPIAVLLTGLLLFAATAAHAQDAVLVLTPGPVLSTIAGSSRPTSGSAAAATQLATPSGVAYDAAGNLFLADTGNHRIQRVTPAGVVTTVAGSGVQGFAGDGGLATAAQLDTPLGVALGPAGELYIADSHNQRIRRVAVDGTVTTVAGNGTPGFAGDTGPATAARLRNPSAVAVGLGGELYIADSGNHRIRRVALDGVVQTVAGSGKEDASGDGGPALLAGLDAPSGVAVRPTDGALLIADRLNSRVRVVGADSVIHTLPNGTVPLRKPSGIGVDTNGTVYLADTGNYRLQAVTANGSGVLLGSGEQGLQNPSSAPSSTALGAPYAIVPDTSGGVAFSDRDHAQVQHLAQPQLTFATTVAGQTSPAQTVRLQNPGAQPLAIQALQLSGHFSTGPGGNCGTAPFSLAAGSACTVSLVFAPVTVGPAGGVLAVLTDGLPRQLILQGTAVAAGTLLQTQTILRTGGNLSYAGTPVTWKAQVLAGGTAVPTGVVHLLDASAEMAQTALDGTGNAAFTSTALTAGQHSISAHYDGDARYASSDSATQVQTVVLAPDFTLTSSSTSLSMASGGTAQIAMTLQPLNGTLNQQVTLAVAGLPAGATVTNDASTPLVLASNAVTVNFAVKTPAVSAALRPSGNNIALALLAFPLLLPVCSPRGHRRATVRLRATHPHICLFLGSLLACLLLAGCGGGYLGGARTAASSVAHSYPVTVTATTTGVAGPLVHTAGFTLVVQ